MEHIRDFETNLYSREFFDEELERLSKKRDTNIGVVVVSLDTEKGEIIKSVGEVLKNSFRGYDIVSRLNVNEFGILLEDVTEDAVVEITDRIKEALASMQKEYAFKFSIVYNISKSFFGNVKEAYEDLRKKK